MRNKKLFLPAIILMVSILLITIFSVAISIAKKPTITEAEFPFKITYELDGKTVTIDDVYKVNYVPNDADDNHKGRVYEGKCLISGGDSTNSVLKQSENCRIELWTHLYPDYLMGDPEYDYFEDQTFEPTIYYYDENEVEYHDEETLAAQGVKLISFEYPTPIENSLVFSHFSYLTGVVVLPLLLIAFLAFLAVVIFVRKEKELKYKAVDIISIIFNWIIGTLYMGFVTISACLIDIEGGGPELYYQIIYFIPAFSLLCITASVALRRKGHGVKSLIVEFIGPIVFALYLIFFYVGGLA
jgi:hypothetical protein